MMIPTWINDPKYDFPDLKEHPAMKYVDMDDDYDYYDDVEWLYFESKKVIIY